MKLIADNIVGLALNLFKTTERCIKNERKALFLPALVKMKMDLIISEVYRFPGC